MRNIVNALIIFVLLTATVNAEDWESPIDIKYTKSHPEHFANFESARVILNNYRGKKDDLIKAMTILDIILDSDVNFAPAYREYGRLMIMAGHISYGNHKNGSLGSAESAILKSISIEPEYADSYVLLGHLYTRLRDYDKATDSLIKADKIGTNLPWLNMNWGELLIRQNKLDEALNRYMLVAESNTDNRKAYNEALGRIAIIHRAHGDYTDAREWYEKSIKFEKSAWNYNEYGAFLLFYNNDIDGAIEKFEKALSIMDFGLARTYYACSLYAKWARLYKEDSDNTEALTYYNKAFKMQPNLDIVMNKLKNHGTTKKAFKLLQQIKIDENNIKT